MGSSQLAECLWSILRAELSEFHRPQNHVWDEGQSAHSSQQLGHATLGATPEEVCPLGTVWSHWKENEWMNFLSSFRQPMAFDHGAS